MVLAFGDVTELILFVKQISITTNCFTHFNYHDQLENKIGQIADLLVSSISNAADVIIYGIFH